MDVLYHQTNRMLREIEESFQKLVNTTPANSSQVENEIQMKITAVNSNCDRLDVLLYKVPVTQRPSAKLRVDQLKYDARHLQSALQLYREKKQRREIELSEREQLLNRRFTSNQETCVEIDSLQENSSLNRAHQGVDEMLHTGNNILGSLINQRDTLKGTRQRIIAIGSTLGVSNHTMKLIEKRFSEDKYVLLFGMFITLVVISFVIYFIIL